MTDYHPGCQMKIVFISSVGEGFCCIAHFKVGIKVRDCLQAEEGGFRDPVRRILSWRGNSNSSFLEPSFSSILVLPYLHLLNALGF